MMNISTSNDTVRIIKQGDPDWMFQRGVVLVPRASVRLTNKCPDSIAWQIRMALQEGWITLEAHVPDVEYAWEQLQK